MVHRKHTYLAGDVRVGRLKAFLLVLPREAEKRYMQLRFDWSVLRNKFSFCKLCVAACCACGLLDEGVKVGATVLDIHGVIKDTLLLAWSVRGAKEWHLYDERSNWLFGDTVSAAGKQNQPRECCTRYLCSEGQVSSRTAVCLRMYAAAIPL